MDPKEDWEAYKDCPHKNQLVERYKYSNGYKLMACYECRYQVVQECEDAVKLSDPITWR